MNNGLKAGGARHDARGDGTTTTGTNDRRRVSRRLAVGLFAAAAAAASTACSTTKAASPVERPALEVPRPPARVVVPLPAPERPIQPVEDLAPGAPPRPPRPRPQREKETPKQEVKPEEPRPAEPAPPPAQPPPPLRMPETANSAEQTRQIQESIARARGILGRVDYGPLSNIHKKAYEDSKMFAQQAEEALKINNLALAKELADKAERLAKEVQGR